MTSLDNFDSLTSSIIEEKIAADIKNYLDNNILKSVLLFPPVNSYKRFIIHQTVQTLYEKHGLMTFSIGIGSRRRTVLCKTKFLIQNNINRERSYIQSMERSKEQPIPLRRKTADSHYIPPPARKANSQNDENMKERVRIAKLKLGGKESKKACNDSSLLFQENQSVKQLPSKGQKKTKTKYKSSGSKTSVIETTSIEPTNLDANDDKLNFKNIDTEENPIYEAVLTQDHYCKFIINYAENIMKEQEEQEKIVEESSRNVEIQQIKTDKSEAKEGLKPIDDPPHTEPVKKTKAAPVPDIILTLGDYSEPLIKIDSEEKIPEDKIKKKKVELETKPVDKLKSKSKQDRYATVPFPFNKQAARKAETLPEEVDDWETLYDDPRDNPLTTQEIHEITEKVGRTKILQTNEKYDDDTNEEGESVIEIYGFSEDIKTSDLIAIFGSYTSRGFNLKWVDDTHALGIFPSPRLAEEVLNTNLPLIKTRPISKATQQSQIKARSLVLPSATRPKTCTALARRLVTGALGLKVSVTPEQRAAERELLRQARETKKQAAKDREAAWEGNFPSSKYSSIRFNLQHKKN